MSRKIIFSVFLLFVSTIYATNINDANFRASISEYHFKTDMQFTTDFTLSLHSGEILEGNPNDIETGDIVCAGSVLRVTPTYTSKWATSSDIDIDGLHPFCEGDPCPSMISYTSVNTNKDVEWLSTSVFNDHDDFGQSNDFSESSARYNELGTFHNQRVSYHPRSGVWFSNKRGGANVFCKGKLQVRRGPTVLGTPSSLPNPTTTDVALNNEGTFAISTRISDADCFGVMVVHPTDPLWLDYYVNNVPSAITGGSLGLKEKSVEVQTGGGLCWFFDTSIEASGSPADEDLIMLEVRVHNNGDPILVTDVSSSNSDYLVDPFPVDLCDILGFPPSICPDTNGFDEDINTGTNKDLFVLLEVTAGASGDTTLTFDAETVSSACGGAVTCSDDLTLDVEDPFFCDIEPPSLEYSTNEVAEFLVVCYNFLGNEIPCDGDDWYWSDGVDGDFIEKDDEHALAYPTSAPGSSGRLNYESGTAAHCWSEIDVTGDPTYECEFIPDHAELNISESEDFELNCFHNDASSTPDDAEYDLIEGLEGDLSNEDEEGVTFTGTEDSEGRLRGYASWDIGADDPLVGAVAFADIIVGEGYDPCDEPDPPEYCDDDDDDEDPDAHCKIGDGPLEIFPGASGYVNIICGPNHNLPCIGVSWSKEGPVTLSGSDEEGTLYSITGEPGESGRIKAHVVYEGDSGDCWLPFYIEEPECWEYT